MTSKRLARTRCVQHARRLAKLYPSVRPFWREYRFALDTDASREHRENARRHAWNEWLRQEPT